MKKRIVGLGSLLVVGIVGSMLMLYRPRIVQLTEGSLRERTQAFRRQLDDLQTAFSLLLPAAADYLADFLIGAAAVCLILLIHLLVFVPIQVYSIHRKIDRLETQISSIKHEVLQVTQSAVEAAQYSRARRGTEGDLITTKSPLEETAPRASPPQRAGI